MIDEIQEITLPYEQHLISLRRYFHAYPEIGLHEFATQQKIMEELKQIGLHPRQIARTGVIAEISGRHDGKTIAIRADMDALPISDESAKPYQSRVPGICHACGHDGHMAILLGVANVLHQLRHQLPGTIRLLFQPNEECFPGGADVMIDDGALKDVDFIIGAHLWQPIPVGYVGISYGRMMASPDEFTITISRSGGHGSMPDQTVDPILVASQVILSLQSIVSRKIDPLEPAVVSVGVVQSGSASNIIPDKALLRGTVRTFDDSVRKTCFTQIEKIASSICAAAGATCDLRTKLSFPPVVNNPAVSSVLAESASIILGKDQVSEIPPVMGGEDFACYLEKIPGAFIFIGIGNPSAGIIFPHHHPKFDMDESALRHGVEILSHAAIQLLTR